MKELLYKQLKLVAHPMTFVFILCGSMVMIPSYPYSVSFFYVTLGLFFMFQNAREQNDNKFCALLPIRKRDTVKCSVMFCVIIQLISIIFTVPFIVLSSKINPNGSNPAGIDANISIIALGFILYGLFNLIFLSSYYKTGYKIGISFVKANIASLVILALDIVSPHIFPWVDTRDSKQYILFAASIVIYALATLLSYKISAKRYEKVDL